MRKFILLTLSLAAVFTVQAQQASKKPIDHSVYDGWQSVANERVSNDGQWITYVVKPQQGDAELVITDAKNTNPFKVQRSDTVRITSDSKYAAFLIRPFYKDIRQARIKKKKPEDMPKDTLGYTTLGSRVVTKVPSVRSFKIADQAPVIAYLAPSDTVKKPAVSDTSKKAVATTVAPPTRDGANLTVLQLMNGKQRTFQFVTEYQLSKNGKLLAFAVTAPRRSKEVKSALYIYDVERDELKDISNGRGNYKSLAFDETGKQFAFAAEKNPEKALVKPFKLYYYTIGTDSAKVIAAPGSEGMPAKWAVSGDGRVYFSKSGSNLFFGTAPIPKPVDTTIVDFEVAKLDIWNYKDDYLQPQQLKNLQRELRRNYLAVMHPMESNKLIQLANQGIQDVTVAANNDARYAIGTTDTGTRVQSQWEGRGRSVAWLIDVKTGERRQIANRSKSRFMLSPGGNFVLWFDPTVQNWFTYNIATGRKTNLTASTGVKMGDEENDVPDDPSDYGIAGWTTGDKNVLIYDRYDIWSIDPSTGAASNFTNGLGRKSKLIFRNGILQERNLTLSDDERAIPTNKPMWLIAQNEETKQWGFYKKSFNGAKDPQKVITAPMAYSTLQKAKNSDVYIYTKQSYTQSPDLYVSTNLSKETKLSSINPQQAGYNWGTAELISWATPKGYHSKGILYKPENFDPNKKYPMLVYFYETLSEGLFNYVPPAPTPSRLPISYFVSNGYLVFVPDIHYTTGQPGGSAMEFVNSGVEALKKNTWVDGAHIGLQGQSWGGYQVAFMITRTNMYAAAWAGAPVANMTSAYNGIRWETGVSREFQYEKGQSRIGTDLWSNPQLYIENSPLFSLPKVATPVVIMSNDADGAVPWYQGIEMFTALRRLGKQVWLLQYNDEAHNLVKRQNRKDITIREAQYFDHFLKGGPMPVWLDKGVPAVDKGKDWGFEISKQTTDNQ